MKKKFKKVIVFCYSKTKDCVEIIFQSAANNQMRLQKSKLNPFGSYVQLKKYQKRLRKLALRVFLAAIFLFMGILIGPAVFVPEKKAEIYIPNGKGDIIIGNVSKNQASVIFKTLDSANQNKPLATAALVEIYEDAAQTKLVKKTQIQDYAVTHIVSVEDLNEGEIYYVRILASESKDMENAKEISFWGGSDPIKIHAVGDVVLSVCESDKQNLASKEKTASEDVDSDVQVAKTLRSENQENSRIKNDFLQTLTILGVQNENYLHGRDKVQTIVSWETNLPGTSILTYREEKGENEKEIKISDEKTQKHAAVLTTLKPGTVYYFRVRSEGGKGDVAVSDEYSLRTPHPKDTIFEMVGNNFKALIRQVGL